MRMLNQAIEDAAAFGEFRDALTRRNETLLRRVEEGNRAARRARDKAERKAAKKAQPKVKT